MNRVFIVAESARTRERLEDLLDSRRIEVVGSASNLENAAEALAEEDADVLLVEAPNESVEELLEALASTGLTKDTAVVVLVDQSAPVWAGQALEAGIRGVLTGDADAQQLARAVEAAASGLVVLDPGEVRAERSSSTRPVTLELSEPLTARERQVLQMLAGGLGNKEIASRLKISEHTAKFHVASILGKFGASSRTEAVAIGLRRGLILL
ncbi:MAG TPA: response regulator transcription factor [Candidatus Sulfotelmatobacter sp.]|nr:response regulator transcription factor [Candidatus Sulfotelmatobacter sp.]